MLFLNFEKNKLFMHVFSKDMYFDQNCWEQRGRELPMFSLSKLGTYYGI